MNCTKTTMRLYAVTDRAWTGRQTLAQQVEAALRGGVTCVQLRDKHPDPAQLLPEARALCALCHRYGVPFIVNDDLALALRCGADGVHLGQGDLPAAEARRRARPGFLIGVSAHSVAEAQKAQADGADYLGVGAVFPSATKADAAPLPHETLRAIRRAVPLPIVAIGGIRRENMLELVGCGADGVALVRAIFGAQDIEAECRALRALAEQMAAAPLRESEGRPCTRF